MSVQEDAYGNIILGQQSIAENAVNGFVYFPTIGGQPSGTPIPYQGMVPVIFDTVNQQLWAYNGTWVPGAGGGAISYYNPQEGMSWGGSVIGIGTLEIAPMNIFSPMIVSAADIFVSNSYSATNAGSSWAVTHSASLGLYTKSGASLSLASSGSVTYAYTVTGSTSSVSYQGLKAMSLPLAATLPAGNYWYGYIYSTASAGNAIAGAMSNVMVSISGGYSTYVGAYGQSSAASALPIVGAGQLSVTTAALPTAIALSDLKAYGNTGVPVVAFKNY